MIYDCFTFNNELDVLLLRLHELSNVVDMFVLVESPQTFSGLSKPFYFQRNKHKFAKYLPRIIHIIDDHIDRELDPTSLSYFPGYTFQRAHPKSWAREINQRNSIALGLKECSTDDIILIGDVDEIPRATMVAKLKKSRQIMAFEQNHYYYFLNCLSDEKWLGTRAVRYYQGLIPEQVRTHPSYHKITGAGWHFSFLGGYREIVSKIKSYAHQEHNKAEYLESHRLKYNIANALDIFDRPFRYQFVTLDGTYPQYLLSHKKSYEKYIFENHQSDPNTLWLREEVLRARSKVYWQNMELSALNSALFDYQAKYRQALRYGPLYYMYSALKKKIKV